jgi:osmoprotectant transport system permease protein
MEQLLAYITDAASWQGETGIPNRLLEHLAISLLAVLTASALALPLGFYIGHTGRLQLLGINIANIGPRLGLRFLPVFLAMVLLAIPPILVATYAGLQDVDPELTESSRGMGLTERQILLQVELPLALPVIVGGFRIALLQVIATATIGAFLAGGGLGRFIIDGIARRDDGMLYAGVLLVAVLAIGTDILLSWLERRLTPRGVRVATQSGSLEAGGTSAI